MLVVLYLRPILTSWRPIPSVANSIEGHAKSYLKLTQHFTMAIDPNGE